jgi:uncharacterized RDD family membrane protein YckC
MRSFNPHETVRMKELEGKRLAPFIRRGIAFIVDCLISAALSVVLYLGYDLLVQRYALLVHQWMEKSNVVLKFDFENWYSLLAALLYFGLATYFGNGKSLGKKMMKIRVVSLTHERITLWQSIERALGYGASMLEGGFGFIQCFTHPNRRTVHDRIAETIVIDEK